MTSSVGIRTPWANRVLLLPCVMVILAGLISVPSVTAADQRASNTAPVSSAAIGGVTQSAPASQLHNSQPLNWGALNPQPLPPGPPDPSRSLVSPANAMGQHGIIIIGGKSTQVSSPGSSLNPLVGAPVAAPLAAPNALGMQTQTSQQPTAPPTANAVSNR